MKIKNALQLASLGLVLAVSSAAYAKGTPQTHHCKLPDGTTDTSKTHKQCTAAKGTWAKDAAAADAAAPAAAAPAAAPAAAAPTAAAPAAAPAPKN
jgi:hypothetical protein